MFDIYFENSYGKLYEKADKGIAKIFDFESENGKIKHQFIQRQIPKELLHSDEEFFDIVTPYGYGGPLIINATNKEKLLDEFEEAFGKYCQQEKIVAEFLRFHPIANNALDFTKMYNPIWDRNTLGTNLKDYEEPQREELSKGARKNIRQALNKGVTYRITEKPENLDAFKKVYYDTMDRNDAGDYYYFDDEYFDQMMKHFSEHLLLIEAIFEEKVIAAGLYFLYDGLIHIHLSGTYHEYLYLSPAYILRYALILWGKEHGYEMIHHGGGRSNKEDDPLFLFKKQFAVNTKFDFYIGKKVWMPSKYSEICKENNKDENTNFFPAYRA